MSMKNTKLFISKDRNKHKKRKLIDIQRDRMYSVKRQVDEMEEEKEETFDEYFDRMMR